MTQLKGIYLFPHDLAFLRYIHAVKVATYRQIQRDCYPNLKLYTVGERMRKLEKNKLISIGLSRFERKGFCLVSISKKGFKEFIWNESAIREELMSDAIEHDLNLVDLRSEFIKMPKVKEYFCENEIQTWDLYGRRLNSDAALIAKFEESEFLLLVEYENHMKEERRYEEMIKRYYSADESFFVLFIAKNERTIRKVSSVEGRLYDWDKSKFFYKTANSLLEGENFTFKNRNGIVLNLVTP